jgi:hypothetical protein
MNEKDRTAGATKALAIIEAFDGDHLRTRQFS